MVHKLGVQKKNSSFADVNTHSIHLVKGYAMFIKKILDQIQMKMSIWSLTGLQTCAARFWNSVLVGSLRFDENVKSSLMALPIIVNSVNSSVSSELI